MGSSKRSKEVVGVKAAILIFMVSTVVGGFFQRASKCGLQEPRLNAPKRLVSIRGKATMTFDRSDREVPATTETLIFQKVGCESCFIGTEVNSDGSYEILVGDGKYRIVVVRPSAPEEDLLAPGQERFIDTETSYNSTGTFTFDVKIKARK